MGFWRNEFTLEEIEFVLEKIRQSRTVKPDGSVSVGGFGAHDNWAAFLVSAIGLEIRTDALKNKVVRSAIFSGDLKADFSEKDFRDVVHRLVHKYQKQETEIFRVVFPIWDKPDFLVGVKRVEDVTLNFSPSPNTNYFKKAFKEREAQRSERLFESMFTAERIRELQQCSLCFAQVRANNHADANERAAEAIYEVLGLVNMAKDNEDGWRWSSRALGNLPVSEVLIGPHTTTHSENGTLTHGGFWYENWRVGQTKTRRSADEVRVWGRRYNQLVQGVSRSPWRDWCKTAASRYFVAFSNPNLEEAFLDGWRLFENITGSRYEKVEQKIIRASNVFEDDIELRIIGKHLALRRNLIAHGHPIKTEDEETLAFQMRKFVLPYAKRFILNPFSFTSPQEFWEFLDLPASKEEREVIRVELHRKLSLLQKAAQFREEE
ncbi:hypothetical protein [Aliiroseovarius crassostreae]|uniref:hypothetical protein n=1 Tax=Aliiroseovarius crassostreae TaxID=154981 RepID=UPI00220324DD|nr:hypothetical protein [Aliiroseovarius crassostreae]UWQ03969.1 hypothetical protein K3X22_09700 [Aliiroseovarius crassostreae]